MFTAKAPAITNDMIARMVLPERPVWVGENFEVAVEWLLSRDVEGYEFVVPLFDRQGIRPVLGNRLTRLGVSVSLVGQPSRRSVGIRLSQSRCQIRIGTFFQAPDSCGSRPGRGVCRSQIAG